MNIWFFSAHDQPRGKSARTYDFARALVARGHQVSFFTNSYCHWTHEERLQSNEKWRIEEIDGIRVVWLRTIPYKGNGIRRGLNMISNALRCLQAASQMPDRPDVIIGPSVPLGTGWAAAKVARKKGSAFVFEVRDVWPIALVDDGGLSRFSPVYFVFRALEKSLYRSAQRISATMPLLFDHVRDSGGDPQKVRWIPNGVDFGRFGEFGSHLGGQEGKLTAMYVGGFGVAHDVITIVRAAAELQSKGDGQYRFVIIGNGPKRSDCELEAKRLNLRDIEFRDAIPKADVPKVQAQADILIAAVTDSKAYRFGLNLNKIFDYFASSRPIIFSGKAPNDPIVESQGGYSVNPEDPQAMAQALESFARLDPKQRVEMGARGRAYVERFEIGKLATTMEALLEEAINAKRGTYAVGRTETQGNRAFG